MPNVTLVSDNRAACGNCSTKVTCVLWELQWCSQESPGYQLQVRWDTIIMYPSKFAIQVKLCNSSQTLQFKSNFAIQVKLCNSSQTLQFKSNFAIQVKLCNSSQTLQFKSHFEIQVTLWNSSHTLQFKSNFATHT